MFRRHLTGRPQGVGDTGGEVRKPDPGRKRDAYGRNSEITQGRDIA